MIKINVKELVKMRKEGFTGKEIVKKLNTNQTKISFLVKHMNLPKIDLPKRKLLKRKKKIKLPFRENYKGKVNLAVFEELWNQNSSVEDIAEYFKIRIARVYSFAKKLNLPKRKIVRKRRKIKLKKTSMFQRMMMIELEKR